MVNSKVKIISELIHPQTCMSFFLFCWTQKKIFWRNVDNQTVSGSHWQPQYGQKVNGYCQLVTKILSKKLIQVWNNLRMIKWWHHLCLVFMHCSKVKIHHHWLTSEALTYTKCSYLYSEAFYRRVYSFAGLIYHLIPENRSSFLAVNSVFWYKEW